MAFREYLYICFLSFAINYMVDEVKSCPDIVLQPKTTVGLIGTTVTFTCSNTNPDNKHTHIEVGGSRVNINPEDLPDGVTWEKITGENSIVGYNVYMNVTEELNCTTVRCIIPCPSDVAYLIVVSSLPGPSSPPVVSPRATNESLIVSWSPPWSHPVNYYTVFVRMNNGTILNYTTTDTSYELLKQSSQYNYTSCEVLYVSVEGSTDVGLTGKSNETKSGFIKGVKSINISDFQNISKSYSISKYYSNGTELNSLVIIQFEAPDLDLCSDESVQYSITILNTVTLVHSVSAMVTNVSSSVTINLGYLIGPGETLKANLTITDTADQNISLVLFETIENEVHKSNSSSLSMMPLPSISDIYPSIANHVSSTSLSPQPTGGANRSRVSIATIVGVLIGVLVVIIIIMLVLGGLVYCIVRRKPNARFHEDVALPAMIPNDNYGNPEEVLYDSVLTLKELTRPSTNGSTSNGPDYSPTTPICNADAPLLPPPRANTAADKQDPYSQILPLRERRNMSPLAPLTIEEADYVPMKSTNPIASTNTGGSNNLSLSSGSGSTRPVGAGPVGIMSPRYIEAPGVPTSSNFSTPNTATANGHSGLHHNSSVDSPVVYAIPGPANIIK